MCFTKNMSLSFIMIKSIFCVKLITYYPYKYVKISLIMIYNEINELIGFDYTEDATPYSSYFRPVTSSDYNGLDQLNMGDSLEFPSSALLFAEW